MKYGTCPQRGYCLIDFQIRTCEELDGIHLVIQLNMQFLSFSLTTYHSKFCCSWLEGFSINNTFFNILPFIIRENGRPSESYFVWKCFTAHN